MTEVGTELPSGMPQGPYLRLSPLRHGTDGFFAAAFVRQDQARQEKA